MPTKTLEIDPEAVSALFSGCLFTEAELEGLPEGEAPEGTIIVEGVTEKFGLHGGRVEACRETVKGWLELLPNEFREDGGGGWSFLNLCNDRNGQQWTGLHQIMNELCCLAIALDLGKWQLPKEMWAAFPGGMPYFLVKS